jgi:hypothetical protein
VLKKAIESSMIEIFSNVQPDFILPIQKELSEAKKRGVNIVLALTEKEISQISSQVDLESISSTLTGADIEKLRMVFQNPFFSKIQPDFQEIMTTFDNFLKQRPNILLLDSETENPQLFLILKAIDDPKSLLGILATNKELVNSFTYLMQLVLTMASTLSKVQKNMFGGLQS